jgi:hypothetical protein
MPEPTQDQFDAACRAYERYVAELSTFVASMVAIGVRVKNVEPFANFAEVIAAHLLGGEIQPPANKHFDLLTADKVKIQVKSLRVSSEKPDDNGLDWRECTKEYRQEGKKRIYGKRIDADRLAVVVFRDFWPYALIDFPIESWEKFPAVNVLGLGFRHVQKLVEGKAKTEGIPIRIIDLQERLRLKLPETPPAAPAEGE